MKKILFYIACLFFQTSYAEDLNNIKRTLVHNMYYNLIYSNANSHEILSVYADQSFKKALNLPIEDPDCVGSIMSNGQDILITNFQTSINQAGQVVAVFNNFDEPNKIVYSFNCQNNQCTLTDVDNVKQTLLNCYNDESILFNNHRTIEQSNKFDVQNNISDFLPDTWTSGFGQGWLEYNIANNQGQSMTLSCNAGASDDPDVDHRISFSVNGQTYDAEQLSGKLAFLINGKTYHPLSIPTDTRNGANEWYEFTQAISTANEFTIYLHNKKVAEFFPTPQSIREYASGIRNCEARW
ncbi:hypothetical protein EV694_0974 [Volucribacter psittacicida]|uniref:Uncharacterized protein n=1 Tax=Volucribacter psittacicida TaxID=203482 RepID=A0A4R1FXQ8_9PAST|nr:hypothetical protein [Volucribacter psittacicida]TCJ98564.1 hypothetical protein EV694_0974 [Volucribacter psittacicida]